MKKNRKIFLELILIAFLFVVIIPSTCRGVWSAKTEISNADGWQADTNVTSPAQKIMGTAIQVIRIVGTGISIIMITYIAIKYMSAAPDEKADFKKSATAFIVGAVVLFAGSNILGIIADFANTVF